jgi:hypothetical protein
LAPAFTLSARSIELVEEPISIHVPGMMTETSQVDIFAQEPLPRCQNAVSYDYPTLGAESYFLTDPSQFLFDEENDEPLDESKNSGQ